MTNAIPSKYRLFLSLFGEQGEKQTPSVSLNTNDETITLIPYADLRDARREFVDQHVWSITTKHILYDKHRETFPEIYFIDIQNQKKPTTIHIYTGPRTHVVIRVQHSHITIVEHLEKTDNKASTSGIELFALEQSEIHYMAPQTEEISSHVTLFNANIDQQSIFTGYPHILNGSIFWYEMNIRLMDEHAIGTILGTYLSSKENHLFLDTTITHKAPKTTSSILLHGISKDRSQSFFYGNIGMQQIANKSVGALKDKCLLLSSQARHMSNPNLEIQTNDVQASHSASMTHLDQYDLFYLMSRGLTKKEAEKMLAVSFLEEIIDQIPLQETRKHVKDYVHQEL